MSKELKKIKTLILIMIIGLCLSGITVFPVNSELNALLKILPPNSSLAKWISFILLRYNDLEINTPQLLYGYDWLGFAHIVLAILFIGPYKDPVKNIWVIEFGMIASVLIFPLAFIAGHFRGIPLGWRFIDCSFGVIGFIVLLITHRLIKSLNSSRQN
ncbi:MAG: hypothetical protein ABIY51_11130 [Ferruginibacter sp.]